MSEEQPVNLNQIARRATVDRGFEVYFPSPVAVEIRTAKEPDFATLQVKDLSDLFWSSIDNDDSKDLDQIEYSEETDRGIRVYVGIADVSALVANGSATDLFARKNTTSVYTGVEVFPMLPAKFSTDLTSLNENQKRLAVVVEMEIGRDGNVIASSAYSAIVLNKAQLTYDAVSAWLEKSKELLSVISTESLKKINASKQVQEQLLMQDAAATFLGKKRHRAGALDFHSSDVRLSTTEDGAVEVKALGSQRAPGIIEEFMIAANEAVDNFLESKKMPCLQRVVRVPKNWGRMVTIAAELGTELPREPDNIALQSFLAKQEQNDPTGFPELSFAMIKLLGRGEYVVKRPGQDGLGHFGLASANYSHATAPNRRYPDLITQRLLKSAFANEPLPYPLEELDRLAAHCTRKEDDANRVERQVQKSVIAVSLSHRIGEVFDGVITGVSEKGIFVRVTNPPAEGIVVGAPDGLQVADHVSVKLTQTDPYRGYIDYEFIKKISSR